VQLPTTGTAVTSWRGRMGVELRSHRNAIIVVVSNDGLSKAVVRSLVMSAVVGDAGGGGHRVSVYASPPPPPALFFPPCHIIIIASITSSWPTDFVMKLAHVDCQIYSCCPCRWLL